MKWTAVARPDSESALRLIEIFAQNAKDWIRVDRRDVSEGDLILSVGGDGTAMGAMRLSAVSGARIVAVHAGTLGFLADHHPNEIADLPDKIMSGTLIEDERSLLLFRTPEGKRAFAANEFVLSDVGAGIPHSFAFVAGGHSCGTFSADGLLLSTPTGSTAYSMSAGGSVLHPQADTLIVSAIAPMSLSFRPVCIPSGKTVVMRLIAKRNSVISLKADNNECFRSEVQKGQELSFNISRAATPAVFLRNPGWDFFDTLSEKLGWASVPGISQA